MKLKFTKMHGAGNDFVVIDAIAQDVSKVTSEQWRALAHRQFGVGADQILLVEKACRPDADFRYRIFNADGGEVEQCGNGSRCFVRYVHDHSLSPSTTLRVEVMRGLITLNLTADGQVSVDMGAPAFEADEIPFLTHGLAVRREAQDTQYAILLPEAGTERWISVVSMGNPHAVQLVHDVDAAPVREEGPLIERHPTFPQRVNAGYMQIVDRGHLRLRVFERGAGETLSCGTCACAAVVAGIRRGLLDSSVKVDTRGGQLFIRWAGPGKSVMMTGPTKSVYEGEVDLEDLQQSALVAG
ncbi:MAG: diaminopimelate epimerase [Candidatus Protistobacter heckmanni]|nr:diaminopimelate epimerase [Candidatus Protistobacter heckmanni]MCS6763705.1 diaminopimelate epimerase [Candidatus Protistobacter heckmanni]